MLSRKTLTIVLFTSLFLAPLLSQPNKYGVPIISNYNFRITGGSEQNWCITQDHRGVMYFGNNDKGVLEYDGEEWRSIPISDSSIVRSMVTGDDGIVYVGTVSDFGHLVPDENGTMHFRSLSGNIDKDQNPILGVWKTYYNQGKVYFCTRNRIFVFDTELEFLSILKTTEDAFISFFIDSTLYIGDYRFGLMRFESDTFRIVRGGEVFREKSITGIVRYDSTRLMIATYFEGLYLFDLITGATDPDFVNPEINQYLKNGIITSLNSVNEDFIATTQFNGLVKIDREGNAKEIITEDEGLIDQTITTVYSNDLLMGSGPLWVAHFKGISKLEINNPFRVFTGDFGLEGLITDITSFNETIFVSTNTGVFFRESSSTGTQFSQIRKLKDERISQLHPFNPSPDTNLLLAISNSEVFVIDKKLNVTTISQNILNRPENIDKMDVYGGNVIVEDPKKSDIIFIGGRNIIGLQYRSGKWKEIKRVTDLDIGFVLGMKIDKYGYLWMSTVKNVIRFDLSMNKESGLKYFTKGDGLPSNNNNQVFIDPDSEKVLLGTTDGFYRYNHFRNTFFRDSIYNKALPLTKNHISMFYKDKDGDYWFSFHNQQHGWMELVARKMGDEFEVFREKSFHRLPNYLTHVFFSDPEQGVWFEKSNELYHFNKSFNRIDTLQYRSLIRNVYINKDSLLFNGTYFTTVEKDSLTASPCQSKNNQPIIKFRYNNIRFKWAAPFFENEYYTNYNYKLENFDKQWSGWTDEVYKDYTYLPHGQYTMQVKAKNIYGDESIPEGYTFTVLRPWYATIFAILTYAVLASLLILLVIRYTRNLKQGAAILAKKNKEIEHQKGELENLNEEITTQKDEIEAQRDSLVQQKDLIDQQNTAIKDSIKYARRIQDAVLPAEDVMRFLLPKHFVFYRPRDIVSGDFFWVDKKDEKVLIALGDCTGHGVPGAFMSMLCISLLNEISSNHSDHSTNELMDELRDQVITSLRQTGEAEETKDGIDMGLVALNTKTREIQFTGAHHNLYLFEKGELIEVKGDRMPVGIHTMASTLFKAQTFKLNRGDSLYLFSDGFPDQFGGERGKKYGYARLKKFLLDIQEMIMHDQMDAIAEEFDNWKGDLDQIDDVLVIGIKL